MEVGSWVGGSAIEMARAGMTVYCVDNFCGVLTDPSSRTIQEHSPETVFRTFCANVGPMLMRRIIPCVGSSKQWAEVWPLQVALVFIDADHSYEACKADIERWRNHVAPGGILAVHDYSYFPGVTKAVRELMADVQREPNSTVAWEVQGLERS